VKVLFDACVPRPLRKHLSDDHEIRTAQEMGWETLTNGDLVNTAESQFDALVTSDQGLRYQQNLTGRRISIIVLPTNFLPDVLKLAPNVSAALQTLERGAFVEISKVGD
jgi:predicted nuclease of predicted toxin-antitoxin system